MRGGPRWLAFTRVALGYMLAISLALCSVLMVADTTFAFYMMPTRLWQLCAGVALFAFQQWAQAAGKAPDKLPLWIVAALDGAAALNIAR